MKEYNEIDVFYPDENHKVYIGLIYNIFANMVLTMAKQLEDQTYEHGLAMFDYSPAELAHVTINYGTKLYLDDKTDTLYMVLTYLTKDENGEYTNIPLVHVNVSAHIKGTMDCDGAAYLFAIGFIQHTGQMFLEMFEKNDEQDKKE